MIDAAQLLGQAKDLVNRQERRPRQVDLRRGISAAYYAFFHATLTSAADLLVGKRHRETPRYDLVYRSIEHAGLLAACKTIVSDIRAHPLNSPTTDDGWGRFLVTVSNLQNQRHAADYDPTRRFARTEAPKAIEQASDAVSLLQNFPAAQRDFFLTRLVVRPRR